MKNLTALPLRLRVLLIFLGLAAGVAALFALGLYLAGQRLAASTISFQGQALPGANAALTIAGAVAVLGAGSLVLGVWYLFDRFVARPIEALAGGLRTGAALDLTDARYLADLGPAARASAEARARQAEALTAAIEEHAAELAQEKAMLEAILSDIGAGAVMSDAAGRVVFYNASAARMLPGLALDRPLTRYIRAGALAAAQKRLAAGVEATDLTCLTETGDLLSGRLRMVDNGALLILRDRPANAGRTKAPLEALRRHSGALVPLLDDLDGPLPPGLTEVIRAEGRSLAQATRALSEAMEVATPDTYASLRELAAGLDGTDDLPSVEFQADAGAMNALLVQLAGNLADSGRLARLGLATNGDPAEAHLVLSWPGAALPMDVLESWLSAAVDPDQPDRSGADLLAAQGTGIWSDEADGHGRLVLPLPLAPGYRRGGGLTYDFALASRGAASSRLADLTCVVFDTETTGLAPDSRIVQIAGVRIARSRLTGERFDTMVNPGIPIPEASTAVHGITDDMVRSSPDPTAALTAFSHFTEGTVLVAHNARFDMGILRHATLETGVHFDNRVLDTMLLSAMVYGEAADHTLDGLTRRLGIVIPPEERHTAMGDTRATAEAFLRLISALEAKGLSRLEAVIAESRKFRRVAEDSNWAGHPEAEA